MRTHIELNDIIIDAIKRNGGKSEKLQKPAQVESFIDGKVNITEIIASRSPEFPYDLLWKTDEGKTCDDMLGYDLTVDDLEEMVRQLPN